MANEKKIAKSQKLLMSFLSDAEDLEKKWMEESDPKKKEKLNKKAQFKKSMVISCAEDIGKAGGSLQNIKDAMTERQQQIIQELFPYGTETVHLERQEKRLQIINAYKKDIQKVIDAEKKYPPYDRNFPVKEKVKNKRYKAEVNLGWFLYMRSQKDDKNYQPVWNYEEHFDTTVEFTEEERSIMERCYEVGKEYDHYFMNEKFAAITNIGVSMVNAAQNMEEKNRLSIARRWIKNSYTSIFPALIQQMNPGKQYTDIEMEREAKEMTKRFIQFIGNREQRDQLMQDWKHLMNDPSIQGYEEHERAAMVLRSVAPQIGEEAAWFTYSCTQIPDTEYGMDLVLDYSYEELGLE
mgnify:FL=1